MHADIIKQIEKANGRAIATSGPEGINVVPVSMAKVTNGDIWLFDFFMNKTTSNLKVNDQVALSCWSGLVGVQVKGTATHITEGDDFTAAVSWVATQNPDRVVKGLIVIKPNAIFDISPGGAFAAAALSI